MVECPLLLQWIWEASCCKPCWSTGHAHTSIPWMRRRSSTMVSGVACQLREAEPPVVCFLCLFWVCSSWNQSLLCASSEWGAWEQNTEREWLLPGASTHPCHFRGGRRQDSVQVSFLWKSVKWKCFFFSWMRVGDIVVVILILIHLWLTHAD